MPRPTVAQVKLLQNALTTSNDMLAKATRKANRAEYLLRLAIKALTTKDENAQLSREVIYQYMEELQNDWALMVMEWTGMKWLDTNFTSKDNSPRSKR